MEESGASHKGKDKNEGQGLLMAFFYGDALVDTEGHHETVRLDYKEECNIIKKKLIESGRKIRFWSEPVTEDKVRDRMISGCKMLHFTGHGGACSLEFEDEMNCGKAKSIKKDDLTSLFPDGGILPELVLLGACESEMCGREVAKAGVPHVVAVKSGREVPDEAAQDFSVLFYDALITKNYTVQQAFDIAVDTIKANAPTAARVFLLLPKNANHEVKIFNDLPKGDFRDESPPLPSYFHLPSPRRSYIGGIKLREVLNMLEDNNTDCLTITGEPGIGKTERALQACHYMGQRKLFEAIFFVHCRDAVAYLCSSPASGGLQAHVQWFCELVGVALDASSAPKSPKELGEYLWMSAKSKIGHQPFKVLLVLDAVDALIEDGRGEARKSLTDFIENLCGISPNLKLLITSEKSLPNLTGHGLSKYIEQVHEMGRLEGEQSAMLLLNLYPRFNRDLLEDEMGIERNATRQKLVKALQEQSLLNLVDGHPGVLCQVSPLLARRYMGHLDVQKAATRYLKQVREKTRKIPFNRKRAYNISKAELLDETCRDIWLWAISKAADDGVTKGHGDDACYRQVPWSSLSLALQQDLCAVQTTSNGVGMSFSGEDCPWSESSSRGFSGLHRFHGSSFDSGLLGYGSDSSFRARDLEEDELNFIRDLLRKSLRKGGNNVEGECRVDTLMGRNSTHYARAGAGGGYPGNDQEEWFSLEAFARFSQDWMGPVITTLYKIRKEWAANRPVKVHGFVSRTTAKRQLLNMGLPGVFMLRFSVSNPGRLILAVTCKALPNVLTGHSGGTLEIRESRVTVKEGGRWTLHYDADVNDGNTFESLSELVYDTYYLKTLYPDISKASAFSTTQPTGSSNISLATAGRRN